MAAATPHPLALNTAASSDPKGKHFVFTWNNPPALLPGRMSRIARAEAETEAAIEEFRNELSGSLSDVE